MCAACHLALVRLGVQRHHMLFVYSVTPELVSWAWGWRLASGLWLVYLEVYSARGLWSRSKK